jgi:SAM-dependent methyltransferase
MNDIPSVDHSRESALHFFKHYTQQNLEWLQTKTVVDLSTGRGYIAQLFKEASAEVRAYDLFPNQNQFYKSVVDHIDLQKPFPLESNSADLVICCETIEHLPNQFFLFQEAARILKPGGVFILTTPNSSSLRSRLSQFMLESEHYGAPAPNELNAFTKWENSQDGYFSKLFISGALRLRTLAALNHLILKQVHPIKRSSTSYLLFILCYPALYYFNRKATKKQIRNDPDNEATYKAIFNLNTSRDVLLGKHLIMEFWKS